MDSGVNHIAFSVIIPSYNRAHTLGRALQSVLAQSYGHFELIVVDDGSTDDTENLVKRFPHSNLRYVYQENAGVCAARNKGAKLALNPWLVFLDSDDWVEKDWLMDFERMIANKDSDLIFCGMANFDAQGLKLKEHLPSIKYKNGWWLHNCGPWAIKRTIFLDLGGYDERLKFGENTELGIRLKSLKPKVSFIDKLNFNYLVSQTGGGSNLLNSVNSNKLILEKHPGYFKNNPHSKQLYLQTIGVAQIRLGNVGEGRKNLFRAWWVKPLKPKAFLRMLIAFSPWAKQKWGKL